MLFQEANKISNEQTLLTNHIQVNNLDFELMPLESPFSSEYHFGLPLPSGLFAFLKIGYIFHILLT